MALRVMWPEGEPEAAVLTANPLKDWWLSFQWGLRGRRTCRQQKWVTKNMNPVRQAMVNEDIMRSNARSMR